MPDIICSLALEDLNKGANCGNNMSGAKNIYFALKDDVASIPALPTTRDSFEDFAELDGNITMATGKTFRHIYCSRDMGELKYTTQGTFGGRSMRASLEIFHPGLKSKLLGMIAATMNSEMVMLVRLNNGDIHVLGDNDRGAEMDDGVEATSGKAITDNNGATLKFVYDTPTAQIYTGSMTGLVGSSTPVTPPAADDEDEEEETPATP